MGDPAPTANPKSYRMLGRGTGPALARWEAELCFCGRSQTGFPTPKSPGHQPGAGRDGQRRPLLLHGGS